MQMEDAFTSAAKSFSAPLKLPTRDGAPPAGSPPPSSAGALTSSTSPTATASTESSASSLRALAAELQTVGASRSKADAMLLRQISVNQLQAVRALAHRAAGVMESWRVSRGSTQVAELFTYFSTFCDVAARSVRATERCLAFLRAASSAAATFSMSLTAAGAQLSPLASGEVLWREGVAAVGPREAQSLSPVASAVIDCATPTIAACTEFAGSVSRMLVGDDDAGKKARAPVFADVLTSSATPPGNMVGLCAWYAAGVQELRDTGLALCAQLTEAQNAADKAFADFDFVIGAHMSGDPRRIASVKGRDAWLAELRYRRSCRALLGLKALYLTEMATLFERFRRVELARSEGLGALLDAYASLFTRNFYKNAVNVAPLADTLKSLNTHIDLCRIVGQEAKERILEFRRASAVALAGAAADSSATPPPPPPPPTSDGDSAPFEVYRETALATTANTVSRAPTTAEPIKFTLEPCPAVISPFASPLIVRTGLVWRQTSIMKTWKQAVAVLTVDARLHVFALEDDFATHPDVLNALFKPSTGGCSGHGGTSREVFALVDATLGHNRAQAANAASPASAAGAASPRSPGGVDDVTDASDFARGPPATRLARPAPTLPPPTLSSSLAAFAATYAARVDDLSGVAESDAASPLALLRKSSSAPKTTYSLTQKTKVAFAPTVHAHAFELVDEKGLLAGGTQRLVLRGVHESDAGEWSIAINIMLEKGIPSL